MGHDQQQPPLSPEIQRQNAHLFNDLTVDALKPHPDRLSEAIGYPRSLTDMWIGRKRYYADDPKTPFEWSDGGAARGFRDVWRENKDRGENETFCTIGITLDDKHVFISQIAKLKGTNVDVHDLLIIQKAQLESDLQLRSFKHRY